jgi:hypothetical protein
MPFNEIVRRDFSFCAAYAAAHPDADPLSPISFALHSPDDGEKAKDMTSEILRIPGIRHLRHPEAPFVARGGLPVKQVFDPSI